MFNRGDIVVVRNEDDSLYLKCRVLRSSHGDSDVEVLESSSSIWAKGERITDVDNTHFKLFKRKKSFKQLLQEGGYV